jgi:hypothetical protein
MAEQVFGASQDEFTVKVTVIDPPHAGGAEPPLLVKVPLHPPLKLAVLNQVL